MEIFRTTHARRRSLAGALLLLALMPLSFANDPARAAEARLREADVAMRPSSAPARGDGTARGLLKAPAESDLSVMIAAPVASIPLREGRAFRKGDVLLTFDCSLLRTEWKAAQAAHKARSLEARSKKRLLHYQATGRLDAAVAAARAEEAAAAAKKARLKVQQCRVRAPYDGWLVARHVDIHETPQPGAKLLTIVRAGALEVEMIVPSAWLKWLRPGQTFRFDVDGVDVSLKGRVVRVAPVVEEVSQTVRIYGQIKSPPRVVRPGMSGTAVFAGGKTAEARQTPQTRQR